MPGDSLGGNARMAELANAQGSGPCGAYHPVEVQILFRALAER